ncbi:MAG: hypothetical protein Q7V88_09170 [Actinomycetota bacterium]|nr:hypothetical protein [Actinomycetota bacterium]
MICSTAAPPAAALAAEITVHLTAHAYQRPAPRIMWCTPETPAEAAYVDCWGVRDWPAADVPLASFDALGRLWLRADRLDDLTPELVAGLIAGTN